MQSSSVTFNNPAEVHAAVGRVVIAKLDDLEGALQFTFAATVEIDGQQRPALVAESIVRRQVKP